MYGFNQMRQTWTAFLATWFGSGNSPIAPGTMGSLAALPIGFLIHTAFGSMVLAVSALIIFIIGVWVTDIYLAMNKASDDPKEVVIDEVSGQWLLLAFMPATLFGYALGFLLFRLFDIAKPWPISWVDNHVKHGFGVMLDDTLAALMGIGTYLLLEPFVLQHITTVFSK